MKYDLSLRPIHYACVSGGKDSLYMFGVILQNPDKYPLDMVVHYDLEIDWDWSKKVVDEIEKTCEKLGIKFVRIKPTTTWNEMYDKWGFPTRVVRWCNRHYKLTAEYELRKWICSLNCRPVAYIGFCSDEQKRFKYELGEWKTQDICYPLAEEGIKEQDVLIWARKHPLLYTWYRIFDRQGCKLCPMLSRMELAYLLKYEPLSYTKYITCVSETEKRFGITFWGKYSVEQVDYLVKK